MALIDHRIPTQNFERIRDRIFLVLKNEFDNQSYFYSDSVCIGATFWLSRTSPFDKSEAPAIVINTFKGDYSNKSQGSVHGRYVFVIDVMNNAKSTPTKKGEQSAAAINEKLIGVIRYILEHQNYITLNFDDPFIEHTEVEKFQIYKDDRVGDASNTAIGQIMFMAQCEETTIPNSGVMFAVSETDVRVELTDNGYQYQLNQP